MGMRRKDWTPETIVNVELLSFTPGAILVRKDDDAGVWLPSKLVDDDSELWRGGGKGERGDLVIPYWLAVEKGLA